MEKSEINNEFILLRHAVRQARVCIVNKLIKEAKLLRDRHGNEVQLEKSRRKADRLIAEVYALKTIKDDDISKFGILDERDLTKILQDQSSSNSVRIMARVTHYKTLQKRLTQFKEKFPDYKKHFTEKKKKKTTKSKDKDAAKTRKSKETNLQDKSSKKRKVDSDENIEQPHHSKDEESCDSKLSEAKGNSYKRKRALNEDGTPSERQKLLKQKKDDTSEVTDKQSSIIKPSSITKEATVKRFTELLEEQESNRDTEMSVESQNPTSTRTEQAKVVDDFFIEGNDQSYQENKASTSYTRSHGHNTRAKAFRSNDRFKEQNVKHKNDTNFTKKQSGKQSFSTKFKKTSKINKNANKSNASENATVDKDKNASLHPSWLAKKKQRDIMSQGFQGKKTVFSDD